MNYTRSQLHERISDLSGQYRAAQENKRLTSEKRAEQDRLSELARQADEKADAQLAEVVQQMRDAKSQYAEAVEELIAPHQAAGFLGIAGADMPRAEAEAALAAALAEANAIDRFPNIFTEPADFQAQALQNGAERVEQAFNEATQ